jgi:phospholipid/cholesterol/gamma-HCH transport system substrate-binding protein
VATKKQKAKVGFFLLVCLSIIIGGGILLSGLMREPGMYYWMEFEDSILGLGEGGLVEYKGVPIGRVRSIYVQENNNARVDIAINPEKVSLQEGVEAQLVLYSFAAGTMAISLTGGEPDAAILPPGSQIPAKSSAFATISSQISELMEQLSVIFTKIDTGFEGMEDGDLTAIVKNFNVLLEDGKGFMGETNDLVVEAKNTLVMLRDDAENVMVEFQDLSKDIRGLTTDVKRLVTTTTAKVGDLNVGQTQEQVNRVLENLSQLTERLNQTAAQFDDLSANAIHEASNIEYTVRQSLEEVNEAFQSVNALMRELQRDPSAVLRGKTIIKDNLP